MHELSIAIDLVEAVCERLPALGPAAQVLAVRVRIGPLAGVVADALRFSFDVAAAGSPIDGARLDVELMPLVVWCSHCQCERRISAVPTLQCPECGCPTPVVRGGRELELTALEVLDRDACPGPAQP